MGLREELQRMMAEQDQKDKDFWKPRPEPSDPWDSLSWWEKSLDILSRPLYSSAGAAHALITGGDPLRAAARGFTGEDRRTYSDVLGDLGMQPGLARSALGFAGDVFLDPTTYLTFGTGAGARATVGGVPKALTELGQAARVATEAEKTAQAARILERGVAGPAHLIPELADLTRESRAPLSEFSAAARPVSVPRKLSQEQFTNLLRGSGINMIAKDLPVDLVAKKLGEEAAAKALGRAAEGAAVPAVMEDVLKGARGAEAIYKSPTLRFAGAPIIPPSAVARSSELAGKAWDLAEKIPIAGKAFEAARVAGSTAKAFAKEIFSTKTGHPMLDQYLTIARDTMDRRLFDTVDKAATRWAKPLEEIRTKLGQEAYEKAQRQIIMSIEGVTKVSKEAVPDAFKTAQLTKQVERLSGALEAAKGAKAGELEKVFSEAMARQTAAKATASQETALLKQAHQQSYGELVKDLKSRGVKRIPGIAGQEFEANIPKWMRRRAGQPLDEWISELTRKGHLPPNATETDFYNLVREATTKPKAVDLESVLARSPAPATPKKSWDVRIQALEGALQARKAALEAGPTLLKDVPRKIYGEEALRHATGEGFVHPEVERIASEMKGEFDRIWRSEKANLGFAPEYRAGYFPHIMRDEISKSLVDIIGSDFRKILKPEFSQKVPMALRRQWETTIDKATVGELIASGMVDAEKAQKELAKRGIKLAADELLVFEANPVVAALKRELSSIRAVTAAEMARDILGSPHFVKATVDLSDKAAVAELIAQHPEHALFVPTKEYLTKMLTPGELELVRSGERQKAVAELLHMISPQQALKGGPEVKAFLLPRDVAKHLSRAYTMQFEEESIRDFVKVWDKVTSWWKIGATAVRPDFHVRNAISNIWQMMLAGVRDPSVFFKSFAVMHNPDAAAAVGRYTGREVMQLAEKYGIRRAGFVGGDVGELIAREVSPSKNPLSATGPVAKLGTSVGTAIEDHARLALFIDGLQKGMDAASAAMNVKKYLFDYRDLTKWEKGFFRRLVPFYSWTRKNVPLAFETMFTKPGVFSAISAMREEGNKAAENPLDQKYLSDFIKDGLGIPVWKNSDGTTSYFLLKSWIPSAEVTKLNAKDLFGQLHPLIKTPIELDTNTQVFSGKPIERFPGEKTQFLGIPMRADLAYLFRNLVLIQEADKLFFQQDWDAGRAAAGALGFRTYAQDKEIQMRSKVYQLQDQMGQLKSASELAKKKYGEDSSIVAQALDQLEKTSLERDQVKEDLLKINPEALSTKRVTAPKPERQKLPFNPIQSLRAKMSISHLLHPPKEKKRHQGVSL